MPDLILITGNSNPEIASGMANTLATRLTPVKISNFADSEIFVEIEENIRGKDVFIIQPTSNPASHNLMELLIMIDAAKRGSAYRITAVIPYYGYARQDRKTGPRSPITAKLIANMLEAAGADRVITLDLHAGQIQGFFDIPLDNLTAVPAFLNDVRDIRLDSEIVIVSPDVGGVVRARHFAGKVNSDLAIIDKRRPKAGVSEVMNIIGDVHNKHCIMIDDMIDSGGTICNGAKALFEKGAKSVRAYCTHGVLSGNAKERINTSMIDEVVVTSSIKHAMISSNNIAEKIRVVDIAPLIGQACQCVNSNLSISRLFL